MNHCCMFISGICTILTREIQHHPVNVVTSGDLLFKIIAHLIELTEHCHQKHLFQIFFRNIAGCYMGRLIDPDYRQIIFILIIHIIEFFYAEKGFFCLGYIYIIYGFIFRSIRNLFDHFFQSSGTGVEVDKKNSFHHNSPQAASLTLSVSFVRENGGIALQKNINTLLSLILARSSR